MPCPRCIGIRVSNQTQRKIRRDSPENGDIILSFRHFPTPKTYVVGFLASLISAVLVVIAMVVLAEYTKTRGRLLLTALMFAAYFFSSMGPVLLAERRPDSAVSRVSMRIGVTALLLLLIGVWGTPNSDAFWKSAAIITVLGLVSAFVAVANLQQEAPTRPFAVKVVALAAFVACVGIAAGINWPPFWWFFTLTVIVWVGALLAPIMPYLRRRIQRD